MTLEEKLHHAEDLKTRIDAFQRPPLSFGNARASLAMARRWDAANPAEAAERFRLCEELDTLQRDIDRESTERDAIERNLRRLAGKLQRSGASPRALDAAEAAKPTEALTLVQRWLPDESLTWLVMCGDKGVGKTVAATWAVRELCARGRSGAVKRATEVAKLSQFDAGKAELDWLKRVDLLVVDDFGTELLNDYARAVWHELLDYRHEFYGRTIITSNLHWLTKGDKPGLADRLGERLVDRVQQAGRVQQLQAERSLRRIGKKPEAA